MPHSNTLRATELSRAIMTQPTWREARPAELHSASWCSLWRVSYDARDVMERKRIGLRGLDLNPRSALIPLKLLILQYAKLAQLAKARIFLTLFLHFDFQHGHYRRFALRRLLSRLSFDPSQDAPSVSELFSPSQRQMMMTRRTITSVTICPGTPDGDEATEPFGDARVPQERA